MTVRYLLDADTLISAHRQYYPFDFCPGFWDWLEQKHKRGRVFSVDAVYAELQRGGDELSRWAKTMKQRGFFLDAGKVDIAPAIFRLSQWVSASNFTPEAIHEFNDSADLLMIAFAKVQNCTVVTDEKSEPARRNKVKIPDACNELQLQCVNLFDLMRAEKIQLVI